MVSRHMRMLVGTGYTARNHRRGMGLLPHDQRHDGPRRRTCIADVNAVGENEYCTPLFIATKVEAAPISTAVPIRGLAIIACAVGAIAAPRLLSPARSQRGVSHSLQPQMVSRSRTRPA